MGIGCLARATCSFAPLYSYSFAPLLVYDNFHKFCLDASFYLPLQEADLPVSSAVTGSLLPTPALASACRQTGNLPGWRNAHEVEEKRDGQLRSEVDDKAEKEAWEERGVPENTAALTAMQERDTAHTAEETNTALLPYLVDERLELARIQGGAVLPLLGQYPDHMHALPGLGGFSNSKKCIPANESVELYIPNIIVSHVCICVCVCVCVCVCEQEKRK